MVNKLLTILMLIILSSCINSKKEELLDENFAIENIKTGMSKSEIFEKIGKPQDSVTYRNHEGKLISLFTYGTNNLFDYNLKIVLDSTDTVISVNFD